MFTYECPKSAKEAPDTRAALRMTQHLVSRAGLCRAVEDATTAGSLALAARLARQLTRRIAKTHKLIQIWILCGDMACTYMHHFVVLSIMVVSRMNFGVATWSSAVTLGAAALLQWLECASYSGMVRHEP